MQRFVTQFFIALITVSCQNINNLITEFSMNGTYASLVSTECSSSLLKINIYLNSNLSLPTTLNIYYKTYMQGKSNELISNSRFQYNMLQCFRIAGEKAFTVSEFPITFCYRYDMHQYQSIVHTMCIPTPCVDDQNKLWDAYEKMLGYNLIENKSLVTTCIHSRYQKDWYQKWLPILTLSLMVLLWLIVGISTFYHILYGSRAITVKEHIFIAFSAKKNIQMLCKMPKQQSTITCMFGIRFITMVWIVTGHMLAWILPYIENIADYTHDIADHFANQWITNFLLSVDVFFVLGGTVNAYGYFQKYAKLENKPTWKSFKFWLNFYRHRMIRLIPAYYFTLIGSYFVSSVYHRAMWPEFDPTVQCVKYWWQNIFLIASLFEHRCIGWTWYVSTEFLLYLTSPIFLLTFAHSQHRGYVLSLLCIALSDAARAYVMLVYNVPPTQLGWNSPPIFNASFTEQNAIMYIKPQYRAAPYIVGLCLGYHLTKVQAQKFSIVHHSTTFVTCGWITAIFAALIAIYGLYPISINLNWPIYYLIYGALHRTIFAFAIAWLIYACCIGYGGFVDKFLSSKLFLPLSVLCYSVYLNHMPVIFASYIHLPFPYHYLNKYRLLLFVVPNLIVAYLLGFQTSLLSEFPVLSIERFIRRRNEENKQIVNDFEIDHMKGSK